MHAVLSAEPISVEQAIAAVESDTAGAVVSFSGVVRNHDGGKPVSAAQLQRAPDGAPGDGRRRRRGSSPSSRSRPGTRRPADLRRRRRRAAQRTAQPVRIWAAHRIGMLEIGDPALVCAVSAAHRGQAFAVCSELVDRIKAQVPIWKEQFFADGTVEWVGAGE